MQVARYSAIRFGVPSGAEAPRHLLLDLAHAQVPLGAVVGEGDVRMVGEQQHGGFVFLQTLPEALDTYSVWSKYAAFVRVFDIDDDGYFTLTLGIGTESDGRIRLSPSFWNSPDNESRLAELGLGNDWGEEDESGYVQTRIGLAPIGDDGTVDLAPLRKAAADALAVVGDNLP